jgi:hypothetical protein
MGQIKGLNSKKTSSIHRKNTRKPVSKSKELPSLLDNDRGNNES